MADRTPTSAQRVEAACRELRCTYCNAEAGKPCVTLTSGFDRREVHSERFHEAFKAGRIRLRPDGCGYEEATDGE